LYDVNILKKLDSDSEKVVALIKRRMSLDEGKLQINLAAPNLDIELPEDVYLAEGLQIVKRAVANDIFRFVPTIKSIKFIENYPAPAEQKKDEQPKVEAAAEAKQ
jgi:peptidylprolyl isomerase